MSMREMMQERPMLMAVIVGVVLVLAVVIALHNAGLFASNSRPRWFYDLQTGELYPESRAGLPPLARDGSQGVMAHVFACGECTQDNRKLAYLEMYTEQGKAQELSRPDDPAQRATPAANPGHMVALPPAAGEQPQWTPADSKMGEWVTMSVAQLAGQCDEKLHPCFP